jgi:hypothetical protein
MRVSQILVFHWFDVINYEQILFIQNQYLQGTSQSEEILLRTFFLICIQER